MPGTDVFEDRLVEVWAAPGRIGTGVAVGERGVLTAGHVIRDALNRADGIKVRLVPTGTPETSPPSWVAATCVWADEPAGWDIALLEADGSQWVCPHTRSPVFVALETRPETGCHSVGFPDRDVQIDTDTQPLRQTTAVLGSLLPAAQARRPVTPDRPLPPRWLLLDITSAPPQTAHDWSGMSGAPVVLGDGRLAALVVEASPDTRQLYVVPLSDALAKATGLAAQLGVLVGADPLVEVRDAARYRASLVLASLDPSGRPRPVGRQSDLAAFGVKAADTEENGGYFPYVARDTDTATPGPQGQPTPGLRDLFREAGRGATEGAARRAVLVTGSAAAGKTRSAAEAAIAELGHRRLLRPIAGPGALQAIRSWPAGDLADALVWLDDVERYLEPGLGESLTRLLNAGAVVVASIRTEQLLALMRPDWFDNPCGHALTDAKLVTTARVKKIWSESERRRALRLVRTPAARTALSTNIPLGVWAIAGPQLRNRYDVIRVDDDHPDWADVLNTVVDWYRTAHNRGIPRDVLTALHPGMRQDTLDAAIGVLAAPVFGPTDDGNALIRQRDGRVELHDYVRDLTACTDRPIAQEVWWAAAGRATSDEVLSIADAAFRAEVFEVALTLLRPRADDGDAIAQACLGVLYEKVGDEPAALKWTCSAATAGERSGQYNLGMTLRRQAYARANPAEREGMLAEADSWVQRAAAAGHPMAWFDLGFHAHRRNDVEQAVECYQLAASAGVLPAQSNLGALFEEQGQVVEAERWYRAAATAGLAGAEYNLGILLELRGEVAEAESWYREAADSGYRDAQYNLGQLLRGRGHTSEAEMWYRKAAEAGDVMAQTNLGALLQLRGQAEEAKFWYRRAAAGGDSVARANLGSLEGEGG